MKLLEALLFGIIQGLTEFLPVSSSGHLALFDKLFDYAPQGGLLLQVVAVHAATLLAVVIVLRRDIISLFSRNRRLIPLLVAGTIPAGVFGLLSGDFFESASANMLLVGQCFLTTALFLLLGSRRADKRRELGSLSLADSVMIGIAQAFAILPGVSRSGTTISLAQHRGVDSSSAARFSFLLMIPAVGGATLLKVRDVFTAGAQCELLPVAVSFIAALVVGIAALKLLLGILKKGRFFYFSYYLFPLGVATILYSLLA